MKQNRDNTTTIRILRSTKEKLDALGKKTDSYDDIISKLMTKTR